MSTYYGEVEYVPGTNMEVAIFKIASSKKGYWYVRVIRNSSVQGYYRKSLRTLSRDMAMRKALECWMDLRRAEQAGVNKKVRSKFGEASKEWLEARVTNGYSVAATRTIEYQFKNHFIPYFGTIQLDAIDERLYVDYLNTYRLDPKKYKGMRKKPTIRSLDTEQSNLKSFLKWCVVRGYRTKPVSIRSVMKSQLEFIYDHRKVNGDSHQRRDVVSTEVYNTYRRYLRSNRVREDEREETINAFFARRRMHFYFVTMYNFVSRAGAEVLNLRFKDLEVVQSSIQERSMYIRMTTKHGKKVRRPGYGKNDSLIYHSDYNYPGHLSKWIALLKNGDEKWLNHDKWKGFGTGPEDYIFPSWSKAQPMNAQATTRYMKMLRPKVCAWSRERNKNHSDRLENEIDAFTPYSVRHIAIRNLIGESNQTFSTVAERANTSVSMIEDFYYKYGLKPEGRLVSKHPSPAPANTRYYEDDVINILKETLQK